VLKAPLVSALETKIWYTAFNFAFKFNLRHYSEGVFGALALMPLFMAKLPTGLLGGYLLQRFCPGAEGGDCPRGGNGNGNGNGGGANATAQAAVTMLTHHPTCDGLALWGVIGLVTMTSPVLILLFYPLLRSSGDQSDGGGGGWRGVSGGRVWRKMPASSSSTF
jgi:hypothetical protein